MLQANPVFDSILMLNPIEPKRLELISINSFGAPQAIEKTAIPRRPNHQALEAVEEGFVVGQKRLTRWIWLLRRQNAIADDFRGACCPRYGLRL